MRKGVESEVRVAVKKQLIFLLIYSRYTKEKKRKESETVLFINNNEVTMISLNICYRRPLKLKL
jgi:hypothetical protein